MDRFPLAQSYRELLPEMPRRVREPDPRLRDPFTERHLHCIWYDDALRPGALKTLRGEEVRIVRAGRWNFEAGPDFLDASWEVGGRRVTGDVEIHLRPMDWRHHGHESDGRYANVRLHVTYEAGSVAGALPPGCEEVSLREALDARSHFFFDSIDVGAYPWEVQGGRGALQAYCAGLDDAGRMALLEAAGQERLRRKTLRMARTVQAVGPAQALYQAVMRGLCYKLNSDAGEQLAQRVPLEELRRESGGMEAEGLAMLLGVAGLLPDPEDGGRHAAWLDAAGVWHRWWRHQEAFAGRGMAAGMWRMDGCRPGNHPLRRLRAAAGLFLREPELEEDLEPRAGEGEAAWLRRCRARLCVKVEGMPDRLVGAERAAALLVNAVIPWRAVLSPEELPMALLRGLPAENENAVVRHAALQVFGVDAHPRLWRGTLRRQGLLQMHEDFGV